jgi:hypothetical protein
MRRFRAVFAASILLVVLASAANCGRFLVVDEPQKSDVILVLAGETDRRPARGLELLGQGYAGRMILNVPAGARVYQWMQLELAEKYIHGLPQASSISICPITGSSTKDEARDSAPCLRSADGRKVLIVTSDYHTRRALHTFQREAPDCEFSVAAAYDPNEFGVQWWRHRQWAKVDFDEWLRLIWWELVDRWR